jgi:anhydro-N-acetylmuramic acid kinase
MSGTSLDGLDMAYCHIWQTGSSWEFEIEKSSGIGYGSDMRERLKNAISLPAVELLEFHNTYGTWLGNQTKEFIKSHKLEVDFIASHGHTVHHQPEQGLTFQLGSGQHLANASLQKVVCDFRTNDVALGGQGAPLVPIGDELFFNTYDFCLNLGGISNISFKHKEERIAYDIGLANMILNYITQKEGLAYDEGGTRAKKGTLNEPMYQALNALEYYAQPFPKSTGYEWFQKDVVPLVERAQDHMDNLLHTAVHHICQQISKQIKIHKPSGTGRILVTGGGAMNLFMMELLQEKLGADIQVYIPSKTLIEYKEALVFALMGVLRTEGKDNVLRSVTGSQNNSSSGVIYLPF